MRLICSIDNEPQAHRFSAYLKKINIDHSIDGRFDSASGHMSYSVWVHNEDQIPVATAAYERFQKNPSDHEFDIFLIQDDEPVEAAELTRPKRVGHVTAFLLSFCVLIYFLNAIQDIPWMEKGLTEEIFVPTPLQTAMLFDVPPVIEELVASLENYTPPDPQKPVLSSDIKAQIAAVDRTPFWRGIYDVILLKATGNDATLAEGETFIKIREGEVWRLVTPVFLHGSILHILFNMLWLWVLGKQVEQRIGAVRYLALTLIVAMLTNTIQYLMSGPFFLGYSGIIMGLAGFIWSREKLAPWEGYPLQRSMILFLGIFVLAMFALQMTSFVLVLFTSTKFNPNIANAAHIGGAIVGAALGRLSWFAARQAT